MRFSAGDTELGSDSKVLVFSWMSRGIEDKPSPTFPGQGEITRHNIWLPVVSPDYNFPRKI
jgi:hypothetical protein